MLHTPEDVHRSPAWEIDRKWSGNFGEKLILEIFNIFLECLCHLPSSAGGGLAVSIVDSRLVAGVAWTARVASTTVNDINQYVSLVFQVGGSPVYVSVLSQTSR